MAVCHTCDNPRCIEDGHHFLGSWKDNVRDATVKGRHSAFRNVTLAQEGLYRLRESGLKFHTEEGLASLADHCRSRWSGTSPEERRIPIEVILSVAYCLAGGMVQHQIMDLLKVSQSMVSRTKRGRYNHRIEEVRMW
jgi:hypothetical protein